MGKKSRRHRTTTQDCEGIHPYFSKDDDEMSPLASYEEDLLWMVLVELIVECIGHYVCRLVALAVVSVVALQLALWLWNYVTINVVFGSIMLLIMCRKG